MPANPNWARWTFASVADAMQAVADANNLAAFVEQLEDRTDAILKESDRAEIRITGPLVQELSKGYFRVWLDVSVLLASRSDGATKNAYSIQKSAGLFQEALDSPIPVWNYGGEPGDFDEGEPTTQLFLGCFRRREGTSIEVRHFGQLDKTERIKYATVDGRFVLDITN